MLKFLVCSIGAVSLAVGALASAPGGNLTDEAPATQGSSVGLGETQTVCCVNVEGVCEEFTDRPCAKESTQVECPCGPPIGRDNQ